MIGIIGGNGVAATNRLCQLIEEKLTKAGAYRDCHHPEMIIWQATQAPSRSMYLEGKGDSFIPDYVRIAKKLQDCGCTELCMCCNTAHYAIDELMEKTGMPFINIIDEVAKRANLIHCKRVGIMCTAGLRKYKLYERSFRNYAPNIDVIYPDDNLQEIVTKGICNSKNSIRFSDMSNPEHPYNCFKFVSDKLRNLGADCVVGGCTDISNVYPIEEKHNLYIDSLEVLASCIVNKSEKIF